MIYSLAYESQASVPLTTPDLLELLERSRSNNAQNGVTGILLYRRGTFLQVLEGPRERVDELYAVIAGDERHHAVATVLAEDRRERRFPDWTMGFADVDGDLDEVAGTDGFNDVLTSVQGPDGEESEKFLELLTLFGGEDDAP